MKTNLLLVLLILLLVACAQKQQYAISEDLKKAEVVSQQLPQETIEEVNETGQIEEKITNNKKENILNTDIVPGKGSGSFGGSKGVDNKRILEAVSNDGLFWRKTGFILSDQASSPSTLVDKEGRLRVYYMDAKNGGISLAIKDGGRWYYRKVKAASNAADPDVVLLANGSYRMYYYAAPFIPTYSQRYDVEYKVNSALSSDGINFVEEGKVYSNNVQMGNPDIFFFGSQLMMFVTKNNGLEFLKSLDGTVWNKPRSLINDCKQSSTVKIPSGYRMYCDAVIDSKPKIFSYFSANGEKWEKEVIRIELDNSLERTKIENPGVERLSDNTFVMFYVTYIN